MAVLAEVFEPLMIALGLAFVVTAVRLDRRVSRGAMNAGPRDPEPAIPPGLKQTPWELSVIDDQLSGSGRVRQDLITTVNRLVEAARLPHGRHDLWAEAGRDDVERVVARLERHLELEPLTDTDPPSRSR